ncbi:hypothetical protein L596_014300 [Steinernema carpocapsae]|uniref:Uncharacterized protein n=1 Tax=Steinernema carpocapsae TaxID=34508 RepID=A0A4U5NBJ8_STECR|nr:hypothetical protein L596_014300 [Steinernema carpocapsae]
MRRRRTEIRSNWAAARTREPPMDIRPSIDGLVGGRWFGGCYLTFFSSPVVFRSIFLNRACPLPRRGGKSRASAKPRATFLSHPSRIYVDCAKSPRRADYSVEGLSSVRDSRPLSSPPLAFECLKAKLFSRSDGSEESRWDAPLLQHKD